jgi:hypothetical protein
MRLNLAKPYSRDYAVGYVFTHKNSGRRYVKLYKKDGAIFVTTYARYLMATHMGKYIPKHMDVDHIDNDKTNDKINNLQLLTPRENKDKHSIYAYNISKEEIEYLILDESIPLFQLW